LQTGIKCVDSSGLSTDGEAVLSWTEHPAWHGE